MTRVSIMLDDDLQKKLRLLQSKMIKKNKTAISFSQVLNEVIQDGLKEHKI